MNKDIEKLKDALENGTLIKTNNKLYWDIWKLIDKEVE